LVGDNDQAETTVLKTFEGRTHTGEEDDVFGAMEVIAVLDEGAVPVKKYRRDHCRGASEAKREKEGNEEEVTDAGFLQKQTKITKGGPLVDAKERNPNEPPLLALSS
jgi:hypothetical protein